MFKHWRTLGNLTVRETQSRVTVSNEQDGEGLLRGRHGWASREMWILTVGAAGCSPARHHASGSSRWTPGGDVDGLNILSLTDLSVQFDEHEVIGVAGMGVARMRDGFDPLEQLLPRLINGRQGMVAKTDSEKSKEGGADYQQPRSLCP